MAGVLLSGKRGIQGIYIYKYLNSIYTQNMLIFNIQYIHPLLLHENQREDVHVLCFFLCHDIYWAKGEVNWAKLFFILNSEQVLYNFLQSFYLNVIVI